MGSAPGRPIPVGLRIAAVLLGLEGLVVAGLAVAILLQLQPQRVAFGIAEAAVLVLYGAGLVLVAAGLGRVRRWARGPAVATQLIQLPLAWSVRHGDSWWLALLLGGAAVAALLGVLVPSSTRSLVAPDRIDP